MGATVTPAGLRIRRVRYLASAAVVVSSVFGVSVTSANADGREHKGTTVAQTNLVANRVGFGASIVDPQLVNAWGMSKFATSPVWVSNNHSNSTTLYAGGSQATPTAVHKIGLTVAIAGDPTGQVANATTGFKLPNGAPARFIFATEQGTLFAWNQLAGTTAVQMAMVANANFKGLAEGASGGANFLYAADFANGRVDIFDDAWNPVNWPGKFQLRHLPKGFAPFNVQALTDPSGTQHLFVAFAKRDPATGDEIAGDRLGIVAEFNTDGTFVRRFDRQGMNAPWGLAYAPASWGQAAGDLLVGQFGDGQVELYNPTNGDHDGTLRDVSHQKLVIDGLWALMSGDATSGGVDSVLFTAGPNGEVDGLYGVLTNVPPSGHQHD